MRKIILLIFFVIVTSVSCTEQIMTKDTTEEIKDVLTSGYTVTPHPLPTKVGLQDWGGVKDAGDWVKEQDWKALNQPVEKAIS